MVPAAAILLVLGILGLLYGVYNKLRAGRVSDAPFVKTGDAAQKGKAVASPKGAISVEGQVQCPAPLTAPMSGAPCLFYEIKCTAKWKESDNTTKEKEIDHQKVGARFSVDDGSGAVWVDGVKEGGDFDGLESSRQEKGSGLLGGITGQDIVFGSYAVSPGLLVGVGRTYVVEEKHLPIHPTLYACGVVGDQPGTITPPKWRSLILSNKTRDQILGTAQLHAKIALLAGGAMTVVGLVLAVLASVLGGGDKPAAPEKPAASASQKPGTPAKPATPAKK